MPRSSLQGWIKCNFQAEAVTWLFFPLVWAAAQPELLSALTSRSPQPRCSPKITNPPEGQEHIRAHQTPIRQQELGASGPRRASRCNATSSTGMVAVGWRGYVAWGRRSKSTASSKGTHGRGAAALHLCPYHRWTRWTPQVTDQCQFLLHRKVWQRFPQASTR